MLACFVAICKTIQDDNTNSTENTDNTDESRSCQTGDQIRSRCCHLLLPLSSLHTLYMAIYRAIQTAIMISQLGKMVRFMVKTYRLYPAWDCQQLIEFTALKAHWWQARGAISQIGTWDPPDADLRVWWLTQIGWNLTAKPHWMMGEETEWWEKPGGGSSPGKPTPSPKSSWKCPKLVSSFNLWRAPIIVTRHTSFNLHQHLKHWHLS